MCLIFKHELCKIWHDTIKSYENEKHGKISRVYFNICVHSFSSDMSYHYRMESSHANLNERSFSELSNGVRILFV